MRYATTGDYYTLFSGARKDNMIYQWDMRDYSKPVATFERQVSTNQRIYFDLSPAMEWLVSGDTTGLVKAWNLNTSELVEVSMCYYYFFLFC